MYKVVELWTKMDLLPIFVMYQVYYDIGKSSHL